MKYTLNQYIDTVNQVLNYPSITYEDIAIFLDQAIAELNTALHIQIQPITYLVRNYTNTVKTDPTVILTEEPTSSTRIPTVETEGFDYYYDTTTQTYKVKLNDTWNEYTELYGMVYDPTQVNSKVYKAIKFTDSAILWGISNVTEPTSYDLTEILPVDWITLYLIPYICFKQSVRDGNNGSLYAEEFSQGFQQLQNAYDVPNEVNLMTVAGRSTVYKDDVLKHSPNLNINVPTRAITQNMLHGRAIMPEYGNMYDNGGWGV